MSLNLPPCLGQWGHSLGFFGQIKTNLVIRSICDIQFLNHGIVWNSKARPITIEKRQSICEDRLQVGIEIVSLRTKYRYVCSMVFTIKLCITKIMHNTKSRKFVPIKFFIFVIKVTRATINLCWVSLL